MASENNTDKYFRIRQEIFVGAFMIISDPDKFTTRFYARDKDDERTLATGPRAVRWCSQGAIMKAAEMNAGNFGSNYYGVFRDELIEEFSNYIQSRDDIMGQRNLAPLPILNDLNSYKKVVEVWRAFGIEKGYLSA